MKLKRETILKILLVLLIAINCILLSFIQYYKTKPSQTYEIEDYDFTNEIRNINYYMTKQDIYNIEGKKEDSTNYNLNWEILIFNNTKMEQYPGTIRYFLVNGRLESVKFEFENSKDYKNYIDHLRKQYFQVREAAEFIYVWSGHVDKTSVLLVATDSEYTIAKEAYDVE